MTNTDFHSAVAHFSDEAWLDVLLRSVGTQLVAGVPLPGFPPEQLQRDFVGSAGEHTLLEAYAFYRAVKASCMKAGTPVRTESKILDFGCGWGRMIRFFSKDVLGDNLFGVDVDVKVIGACKHAGVRGTFETISAYPPLGFANETFDVVFAYSVFSHLNEEAHLKWVEEFHRVLRPGGIFIATTQGRTFIEYCASLRNLAVFPSEWHRSLSRQFGDISTALADYDAGCFLHSATGGGDCRPSTFYGETLIPRQYIERVWTRYFEIREFSDDRSFLPQAYIVVRKPR